MKILVYTIFSGLLLSGTASAKHWHDEGHGNRHERHDDDRDFNRREPGCYFSPHEVRVIDEYYAPRYRNLPPGLQKKLYRTGHLPPGWEKKMEPLPVVVERQLEPIPEGYRRGVIGGSVVVYNPHTQIVVDVAAIFGH